MMQRRQFQIREGHGKLWIGVRFLHPLMTAVMVSMLAVCWGVLLVTEGAGPGMLAVLAVTGGFAWLIGFGSSCLSLTGDALVTCSGPLPVDRRTRAAADIEELSCTLVRTAAGRGGRSERYAIAAQVRFGGQKPATLLYGFLRQEDACEVARLLAERLNALRPGSNWPVTVTGCGG